MESQLISLECPNCERRFHFQQREGAVFPSVLPLSCPFCEESLGNPLNYEKSVPPPQEPTGSIDISNSVKDLIGSLGLHLVGFQLRLGKGQMLIVNPRSTIKTTVKEWNESRNFKLVLDVGSLTRDDQLNLSELLSRTQDARLVKITGEKPCLTS